MITTLVGAAEQDAWLASLAGMTYDVYHHPGWSLAEETLGAGSSMAVVATDGPDSCLAPFIKRQIPWGPGWDAISPYGYAGPVWTTRTRPDIRAQLFANALDRMAAEGAVSFFVRLHPVLCEHDPADILGIPTVDQGPTVVVDLTLSPEERWKQIRSGHRADIRRASAEGCKVHFDLGLDELEDFANLYRATMTRIGANASYVFPDAYFDTLRSTLQGRLLLAVVRLEDQLMGGALFTLSPEVGGIGYHLSAAAPMSGNLQPTKLLLAAVSDWAASAGFEWLHLGGGVGAAEDSLYRFKRGFSRESRRFRSLRVVLDEERYADLSGAAVTSVGFFPAYRDPTRRGTLR